MARICKICGVNTYCTDDCKACTRETVKEIKHKLNGVYTLSDIQICTLVGEGAFNLMVEYGFARYINTNKKGEKMYLILEEGDKQ